MNKKIVSLLLAMVLTLCSGLVTAFAASGECGVNLSWTLDDAGVLTISGSGNMYNYKSSSDTPWQVNKVKKVVISHGATSIGSNAFTQCTSLTQITIPNSVNYIGEAAFYNCEKLSSVTLPAGITDIKEKTFYQCKNLSTLEIPEGVKQIDTSAFYNCDALRNLKLPGTLKKIGMYAFENCDSLMEISIPDTVLTIENGAFRNASSLETVKLPKGLKTLSEAMFNGCSSLSNVTMAAELQTIEAYVFQNCESLVSIHLPATVTTVGYHAFYGCANFGNVYFGGTQSQWEAIKISDNNPLKNATIQYNFAAPSNPAPQSPAVGPGSIINQVLHTDIRAYIDGHPIRSFNIEGNTAIVAEDLSLYGFKVVYKNDVRSLYIDEGDKVIHSVYQHTGPGGIVGSKAMDVYYTDIKTYAYGYPISGYNVNGYTVIFIDNLAAFGTCYWDEVNRTISFYRY